MASALVYLLGFAAMVCIYLVIKKFRRGRDVSYNEVEAVLVCSITLVLFAVALVAD